jgi:hypothetical protein
VMPPLNVRSKQYLLSRSKKRRNLDFTWAGEPHDSPVGTPTAASNKCEQETWQPGQSGNPSGRPVGARQRISEQLLTDLARVRETHRVSVLERLAISDPGKLAQIAYGLLPRDVFISAADAGSWTQ